MKEPTKVAYVTWKLLTKAQAFLETVSDCEGILSKLDIFLDDCRCRFTEKYGFAMVFKEHIDGKFDHVQDVIMDYSNEPWEVVKVLKDFKIKR